MTATSSAFPEARAILDEYGPLLPAPATAAVAIAEARFAIDRGAVASAEMQLAQAEAIITNQAIHRALEILPGSASAYVELARVLEARGDRAGALEALDRALGFWSRAEPDFEPAAEARALRDALDAA